MLFLEYASYPLPSGSKEELETAGHIYSTVYTEEIKSTYLGWCTPTWSLHIYPCHFENVHAKIPGHGPVHAEWFLSTCILLSSQKQSVHLLLFHSWTSSWERHWTPTEDLWDFCCQAKGHYRESCFTYVLWEWNDYFLSTGIVSVYRKAKLTMLYKTTVSMVITKDSWKTFISTKAPA